MPFKLFHTTKKAKKEKSDCTAGTDQSERKSEEPPDVDSKAPAKSKLHLFSHNKNHVHFEDGQDGKPKKKPHTKTKSLVHLPFSKENVRPIEYGRRGSCSQASSQSRAFEHGRRGSCGQDSSQSRPRRSASYGNYMDSLSRERRLMDIAQLDNYMEYLRRTEDEGNLMNRLCCAQVLKLSLIRLEQMYRKSQERVDMCHRSSISRKGSFTNSTTKSSSEDDQDSTHADEQDDNVSAEFTAGHDSDGRSSGHDSGSEPDSEDSSNAHNHLQKSSLKVKDTKTPVWPRDIEIF